MAISPERYVVLLQFLHHKLHFVHELYPLKTVLTAWDFQGSCWHGTMTTPTCSNTFCGCLTTKTNNTW